MFKFTSLALLFNISKKDKEMTYMKFFEKFTFFIKKINDINDGFKLLVLSYAPI